MATPSGSSKHFPLLRSLSDAKRALQLRHVAEDAVLRGAPRGSARCGNCAFYGNGLERLSYCCHAKLRMLVGENWWCQYHAHSCATQ